MFLTRTGFKKLMERSVKGGGLYVRNDGKGYSICGASWAAYFFKGDMPKESLGDLISLVGELPGDEESFTADKGGNQINIYDENAMTAMDVAMSCNRQMEKTSVLIEHPPYTLRVYQNWKSGQATVISEKIAAIVDPELIDSKNGEDLPNGPFEGGGMVEERFYNAVCWYNNRMAFSVARINLNGGHTEGIVKMLEQHTLWNMSDDDGGDS